MGFIKSGEKEKKIEKRKNRLGAHDLGLIWAKKKIQKKLK